MPDQIASDRVSLCLLQQDQHSLSQSLGLHRTAASLIAYSMGLPTHHDHAACVSSRAILFSWNEIVDSINNGILDMFPGDTVCGQCHRGQPASCLATEYPHSLTLRGLPQHKLNIKLGAPVMRLRRTHRPSVWPLQRHRLHRPSHQVAIHHSTHCMWQIFRQCHITFPHSTVTDRCWRRAMCQPLSHKHQLAQHNMQCQATIKPQSCKVACEINL